MTNCSLAVAQLDFTLLYSQLLEILGITEIEDIAFFASAEAEVCNTYLTIIGNKGYGILLIIAIAKSNSISCLGVLVVSPYVNSNIGLAGINADTSSTAGGETAEIQLIFISSACSYRYIVDISVLVSFSQMYTANGFNSRFGISITKVHICTNSQSTTSSAEVISQSAIVQVDSLNIISQGCQINSSLAIGQLCNVGVYICQLDIGEVSTIKNQGILTIFKISNSYLASTSSINNICCRVSISQGYIGYTGTQGDVCQLGFFSINSSLVGNVLSVDFNFLSSISSSKESYSLLLTRYISCSYIIRSYNCCSNIAYCE